MQGSSESLEKSVAKDGFPGYAWATRLVTAGHRCKDHRFSVSRGSWEGSYTKPPLSRQREGICWLPYNPRKRPPLDHPAVTRVNCPVLYYFPRVLLRRTFRVKSWGRSGCGLFVTIC